MLAAGTVESFRLQADFCAKMESPLYAELLTHAADDIDRGGIVAEVLDGWSGSPVPDALPLRLMGGVHRLVLEGNAPELARHFPSVGGTPTWPAASEAFLRVVAKEKTALRAGLTRHVQTNEVRRSAALLAGFLRVSAAHQLPLRVFEIGSSAGLNLSWDRYRYEIRPIDDAAAAPRFMWGDPQCAVTINVGWEGPTEIFAASASVRERAGCDVAPIDLGDAGQVHRLESFVWGDQVARLRQLRGAIALAQRERPPLTQRAAADWLADQLAAPRVGTATVVFHSIMWWYLSEDERTRVTDIIAAAGARATPDAPLAWLRLELMTAPEADLLLTQWPGGTETMLGRGDPHGRFVRFRG